MLWVLHICCGYSLEAPHKSISNEYSQHMFSCRNKKNISTFQQEKEPFLKLWLRMIYQTVRNKLAPKSYCHVLSLLAISLFKFIYDTL